jgi:hypothetical protein
MLRNETLRNNLAVEECAVEILDSFKLDRDRIVLKLYTKLPNSSRILMML